NVDYIGPVLGTRLNNQGSMSFIDSAQLGFGDVAGTGTFINQFGGVIEFLSTQPSPFRVNTGTTNFLRNDGLMDFNTGTTVTLTGPPMLNNGTISCTSGSLLFGAGTFSYGG